MCTITSIFRTSAASTSMVTFSAGFDIRGSEIPYFTFTTVTYVSCYVRAYDAGSSISCTAFAFIITSCTICIRIIIIKPCSTFTRRLWKSICSLACCTIRLFWTGQAFMVTFMTSTISINYIVFMIFTYATIGSCLSVSWIFTR